MQVCRIPEERVEKLQRNLPRLKRSLSCEIVIRDNQIIITSKNSFNEYIARNVIIAFGRGFSIDDALELCREDKYFKLIELQDYAKNRNQLVRIKSRVIGREGKVKKEIEKLTGAKIAIYGKTIALIGGEQELKSAEDALIRIITGSKQSNVLRLLQLKKI
jgi:Predicted RNA-binding protein (contains KH domains)